MMTKKETANSKSTDIVKDNAVERDLILRELSFIKIAFSLKEPAFGKEDSLVFRSPFKVSTKWNLIAIKKDNKGLITQCDFMIQGEDLEGNVSVQTKMEFKRAFPKEQFIKDYHFQILALKIFFPFLIEIIAANSAKLLFNATPLILDKNLRNQLIEEIKKQANLNEITKEDSSKK